MTILACILRPFVRGSYGCSRWRAIPATWLLLTAFSEASDVRSSSMTCGSGVGLCGVLTLESGLGSGTYSVSVAPLWLNKLKQLTFFLVRTISQRSDCAKSWNLTLQLFLCALPFAASGASGARFVAGMWQLRHFGVPRTFKQFSGPNYRVQLLRPGRRVNVKLFEFRATRVDHARRLCWSDQR